MLKTAIKVLEAPMVERGLLEEAGKVMRAGALKAIEKGTENAFSFAAGIAAGKLSELLPLLF